MVRKRTTLGQINVSEILGQIYVSEILGQIYVSEKVLIGDGFYLSGLSFYKGFGFGGGGFSPVIGGFGFWVLLIGG